MRDACCQDGIIPRAMHAMMARVTAVAGEGGGFTIRASCIEVLAARPGLQLPLITHLGFSEYSHGVL